MKTRILIASAGLAVSTFAYAPAPIVFDTPAADEKGMMVLGNGEVGAMAWLDAAGTLHTVLQNSDSWNEGGRHVKTGAIDYETKSPVDEGSYRQELSMERGEFEASWKSGGREVTVRYRVQHGTDSIAVCDVKGAPDVEAKVVNWRLYPGGSKEFSSSKQYGASGLGNQFDGATENGKPITFTINADRLVPGGWCHVNRNETVAKMMKYYDYYQATGDLGKPDLLSNRVFGGMTRKITSTTGGSPVQGVNGQAARSTRVLFLTAITCLHPCKDEAEWLRHTNDMLDRDGWTLDGEAAKRAAHIAAWRAFWDRSHIDVTPSDAAKNAPRKPYALPTNDKLPLSIGVDSKGGNRFLGTFVSAEVELDGKVLYSGVPKVGDTVARSTRDSRDGNAFRFACTFSTDRFEKPQRLLDNATPGRGDGFLVDVLNGQIRLLAGHNWFVHPTKLRAGRKTAIEVVVSRNGIAKIVVNGVPLERSFGAASVTDECAAITLRYAAQRYLNGCTGRGRLPIRFNGSLFTMTHKGDPDYRQWGHGYWWQNTRLPYYTMFASGDLDMLQPLFNMYCGLIDFNMKRTRKYLGHGGAYFPECMQPWGDHFLSVYSANRFLQYEKGAWKDRTDKLQLSGWHKYEWVGQLELSLMLLRYYAFTQDDAWFKTKALPSVREYVRYFDEHYKLDANGRYLMHPAQATEMWWNCTNPMPEIAGLTCVTEMLLALPKGVLSEDDRALFAKIRARIPDLPTRKLGGKVAFAPADKFASHHNLETPELYCVFPFRLCSFEKPNVEIGRHSYREGRMYKLYHGWAQDEVNAAYLGMTEEARVHIAGRALTHSKNIYRWPAYWGPNFNWCPDQDEGGIFLSTIQSMLMQYEGDKIFLLPAWPKDWNCDFKLHAPKNTTIEGRVENGELKDLVVTPASRRKDVLIMRDNYDGESLLDLVAPVSSWDDGIPLGNGSAGALIWGGGNTLNVTLDRADFWHNIWPTCCDSPNFTWDMLVDTVMKKDDGRRKEIFDKGDSATKLPGVRFVLKLGKGQSLRRFRLDGATASATVTVATPSGDRDIVAWFDDGDTLLSMRVPDGVTFDSKEFVKNPSFAELGGYPEPEIAIDDGKAVYRRLRRKGADNRFDRDFESGVRFRPACDAPRSAFWPKFNAESEVSIPDPKLQRLYDFAIYLYGAGARAGCAPLALQGLWTADDGKLPPWHGDYHNDLNTEMTYWAAGPAGCVEALEAFADFYIERLPECREFCRKIFKGGDGAVIPPTMGYAAQPILGWTAYTLPPIHGIWAFNTFCDAWDYDPTPEKAAKYLAFGRELAAGLEHSWKVVDGVRKLTLSCSPEFGGNGNSCFLNANSSYERAILDSFYVWLSRLAEACGNADETVKWRSYVGTFGPPNVTKDGTLEISAGNPLKDSHRHPSHLIQVFPLTNVPCENGVDFVKSVEWWEGLGTGLWVGFSFPWAGCFEARLGRGDRAYRYLKDFARAFTARNGFNVNGDQLKCGLSRFTYRPFTLEANFGYARGIQEMLLSYDPHSNTYRLFPALPKEWDGKEVSFRNLRLPGGHRVSAKRAADGTITHEIVPNPRARSVPRLDAAISAAAMCMASLTAPGAGWRVAELNGAPGLYHDGKPVAAMMFWQWEPQEKDTKDMSAAGMELFAMFGSFPHYRHPYWRKDGSFGMTYQDAHIDNLLSWAPKAAFLPRVFYTAPDWWSAANPSERHVYAPGRKGMQVRESFASLTCREELSPYYRKAVRHLLDRYGDHLMGIHVASGPCGEHFSWDVWGHEPSSAWGDLSEPMRQAFVRYLRRKYGNDVGRLREAFKDPKADFVSVMLPGKEERCKNQDGWRDPAKGRRVLDYLECCNEVTVEMIDHYCGIVKDEAKGALPTLAFYGYVAEDTWANENDHRGTAKMYLSKNLDMLSAPHSYRRRRLGEDGMQRQYLASAALHGKLFIDEGDDMTHLEKRKKRPDRRCTVTTMEESLALLYREFGMTVTHGTGLWYMDLTRGTFRDPQLVDAVGRMRKWAEVALRHDRSHHSEVAVVSQPQSGFYTGHGGKFADTVTEKLYVKQMGEFYRAGAPFDWYLAEDLDAVVKGKAKVIAFLDCQYLSDEQYALALKLKEQGRTLVFFHAPAYASQTALSWERVKRLTGGETYETLKMKSADELRAIYKTAGIHVYTDSDVVLSANSAWLMLHTREAGDYEIALPRRARKITEITTEKPVAENTDRFTWKLPKHSTAVFLLEH